MSYFGYPLYPLSPSTQQNVANISANTTLGAGAATYDKSFQITGAGGYTITLPVLDGVNFPSRAFSIFNNSSALCTVTTQGSDTMLLLGSSFSSVSILPGERFLVQNIVSGYVIGLESPQRTTTAPQFDNTIRTASTAFVQSAIGNFSGQVLLNSPANILASYAGNRIVCAAAGTYTLPSLASVPNGAKFYVLASGNNITVALNGTDTVTSYLAPGLTSISVLSGDSAVFVAGQVSWVLEEGTAALLHSASFRSSLSGSGYQKLPSGLILQWIGGFSTTGTGYSTWTFPTAFSVGALACSGIINSTGLVNGTISVNSLTTTSALVATSNGSTYIGAAVELIVIGH